MYIKSSVHIVQRTGYNDAEGTLCFLSVPNRILKVEPGFTKLNTFVGPSSKKKYLAHW